MGEKRPVEGRPLRESDLIENAKQGDIDAFEELVRLHQHVALRVAYVVLGDESEAEDVVQDAFVKAHAALGRFRAEAPFRPWLLRIVRNEALNLGRRRRRQQRLAVRLANEPISGGAAPSPEIAALDQDDRRALLAAVDALPERYRNVIVHRFLVGLSEREVAETLGIPAGTVKSRTARGLARLRHSVTLRESIGDV